MKIGETAVWTMNSSGFRQGVTFPGGAGRDWSIRNVANYDSQKSADILWRNTFTGATVVWIMNSSGLRQGTTFPGDVGLIWNIQPVSP